MKRGATLLTAVIIFGVGLAGGALAEGEEAAGEGASSSGLHLVRSKVADLGNVPRETKTEERLDVLLVIDMATGVPIREKNTKAAMPVNGALVQLMAVLSALDYVDLDSVVTVSDELLADLPRGVATMKLAEENEVYVSDLIAGMLYTGAVDAALVFADHAAYCAGVNSIDALMMEKAEQLGMLSTSYAGCDGTGMDAITSTAVDQSELYMEALENGVLLQFLQAGSYAVRSRIEQEARPNNGEDERDDRKADEPVIREINKNLPETITNDIKAVVPKTKQYDVRLSSAVSCFVKENPRYSAVAFRATDERSDLAILYLQSGNGNANGAVANLNNLTETFNRARVVDLIPYMEVATSTLTVEKSGVKISGWFLQAGHSLYGRQLSGYDPEAKEQENQTALANEYKLADMKVVMKPDQASIVTNDDGSRTMRATVLVDNAVEGTVTLATAPKAVQTEISQNTNTIYTDADIMPEEPTLMSQYGWMIIIGAVLLLGLIVIIIGVVVRNRLER